MQNKKIKNSTPLQYNNISFKSKLEVSCYKKLETSGLSFKYEPEKIIIWKGEKLKNILSYESKFNTLIECKLGKKLRDITYTPDFKIIHKGYIIYFDVKGYINDIYPLKKKLFLQYLDSKKGKYIFFEPHSVKQMLEAINIINKL